MDEHRMEPVSPIKTTDELLTPKILMLSTRILSFVTSKRIFSFTLFNTFQLGILDLGPA